MNEIFKAGFKEAKIVKENKIILPGAILSKYLDSKVKDGDSAILSVTVTGVKF